MEASRAHLARARCWPLHSVLMGVLMWASSSSMLGAQTVVPFPRLVGATTDAAELCASASSLPGPPTGSPTSGPSRDSATALAESAAVAILAGEPERARDQLGRATALDPSSPELVFRLARVSEDLGDAEMATAAYCRLRVTSSDQAQITDASDRVEALAIDRGLLPPEPALGRFQRGVVDATAGSLPGAERAFDEALARAPAFAIAHYDRGLVRLALGRTSEATDDLRQFALLTPEAAGQEVHEALRILERGRRSPAAALGWGVVPGGSQIYSGRPWVGALVAAVAAAGVVLAVQKETRMEERTFLDPFGQPYTDRVPVTAYPRRTLGFAVAGGATAVGALGGLISVSADRSAVTRLVARVRSAIAQPVDDDQPEAGRP